MNQDGTTALQTGQQSETLSQKKIFLIAWSGKISSEVTIELRPGGWEGASQAESLGKGIPGGQTARAKAVTWECW